ncbi:MAG: hypothetical protein HKO65_06250 [Gemmatimonadetes bacterium]|nr:hypothetical protein [Gemmatimonadota bacterium]NNM04688.1 hypothetical protein [Gemmatimonadota bacterium]
MRRFLFVALLVVATPICVSAQPTEEVLRARVDAALTDPSPGRLYQAAQAARFLREFETAESFLEQAEEASGLQGAGILFERLSFEFASGGGIEGAKAALKRAYGGETVPPLEVATWVNNFPALLVGGEFDEAIEALSADAEDPYFRCECLSQKAWMHRAAGRWEEGKAYWVQNVAVMEETLANTDNPDTFAQIARNYARAGQMEKAQELMDRAMAMPVTDEMAGTVRRRWAQAYVELGDVEKAVEHLEILLSTPSLVSVHSLESRLSWAPVRDEPAFQELLDRYR